MLTSVSMEAKLSTVDDLGNLSPEKISSRVKFRKCAHTAFHSSLRPWAFFLYCSGKCDVAVVVLIVPNNFSFD